MNLPVLEVKNISKIYKIYNNNFDRIKEIFLKKKYHKKFTANDDISFNLKSGETLGIIGTNGAGKSTVLKIIAGVIEPTRGEIIRRGRVTALLELGTGFNPDLSGYENIYLNGMLIGMEKEEIERKIDNTVSFSELGDYIYESISTYSSGMTMRLAFSIAIFSEPQILIVDEALSVGDAHFAQKCTKVLKKRKQENMSIIYVSHDLNSLKILCDRVILLNHGKVAKGGNPESVINSYNFLISKLNDKEENIKLDRVQENSYGTFDIEIIKADIRGKESGSNVISSGEPAIIEILLKTNKTLDDITIGIGIRDRFGQDIFGTNTNYHNMKIETKEGDEYICTFEMPLNIGVGKYSMSVAVHSSNTHLESCYHWMDLAKEFEVAGIKGEFFIGACRLEPKISFKKVDND